MVADGINRITLITSGKCLIVVDELFRQLTESQILDFVPMLYELSECQAHIVVAG